MRRYTYQDYKQIQEWVKERGMAEFPQEALPFMGLVVEDVAAGFLVITDSTTAILDFFIANPKASRKDRDDAIFTIAVELIRIAKQQEFRSIMFNSKIKTIKKRAKKIGFKYLGDFSTYSKEL